MSECCECGAYTEVESLFAMPIGYDDQSLFCEPVQPCCFAPPTYPSNVEARCEDERCVLYVDGEPRAF